MKAGNEVLVAYRKEFANTSLGKSMIASADIVRWAPVAVNGIPDCSTTLVFLYNVNEEANKPLLTEAALNYVRNIESGRWVQTILYEDVFDVADQINAGTFMEGVSACPVRAQYMAFMAANSKSAFPANTEGYWRKRLELPPESNSMVCGKPFMEWSQNKDWAYPFPVVYEPEGYDKNLFLALLREMEDSPFTTKVVYRGISHSRLTGEAIGNCEFERDGWKWPQGYSHYIEAGVPPSRAFYRFVTTQDVPSLPTYGHE